MTSTVFWLLLYKCMIFKVHAYIHNYNYPKVVPLVGCPRWLSGKRITCQCRRCRRCGFDPWGGKILWRRKYQPASVFLPGRSRGQRSLADYSPWDCKELDMTAQLSMHMHSGTGYCLYLYEWGLFRCITKSGNSHWTLIPWGSLVGLFSLFSLVIISSLFLLLLLLPLLLLVLVFLFSYTYKKTEIKFYMDKWDYIIHTVFFFPPLHLALCFPNSLSPSSSPFVVGIATPFLYIQCFLS